MREVPIIQFFPYNSYAKLTRKDVLLIKNFVTYFFQPVSVRNRTNEMKGLASYRDGMKVWKFAKSFSSSAEEDWFTGTDEYQAITGKTENWNRGAYLVNGALHCAQCHTPRQNDGMTRGKLLPFQELKNGRRVSTWLKGGVLPSGKKAPDITKTPDGKTWPILNDQDNPKDYKVQVLSVFKKIDYEKMQQVYMNQLRHLTPEDLSAVLEYLNDPNPFN
ncbi:MAG: cytochrome c [Bdellovibrionales bacterium]|nr:cytochrome c [Bdellovibrionales bacterium]